MPVEWTTKYQKTLNTLSDMLEKPPVLAYPDFNIPFMLYTNCKVERHTSKMKCGRPVLGGRNMSENAWRSCLHADHSGPASRADMSGLGCDPCQKKDVLDCGSHYGSQRHGPVIPCPLLPTIRPNLTELEVRIQ